ncbi:MAG: sugar ABC transporter permease [Spirochaetes bacterium]|nr:sugar ABC transporter permease [Spirochaetota bacterium]MCK5568761.1 sugar ABC transporter permease [Spirochaetota bacterium]
MIKRTKLTPYLLISFAGVILLALTIYPLFYSLILSLHKWTLTRPAPWKFVGLRNYWNIVRDLVFWRIILNTFIFTFSAVTLEFIIGLALALLFNRELRGENTLRSALVLPMMVPPILVGLLWLFMYKKDFGIINNLLMLLGIEPITWLSQPFTAMIAIIIADTWQWTPFMFLLLLAGLRSLPQDIYESANIDGASLWQSFRHITIPLLKPIIAIAVIIRFMDAFRIFDKVFQLTGGGPGISTETISHYIYRNGLRYFKMGYASAISYLALIMIVLFSMIYIRILQRVGEA